MLRNIRPLYFFVSFAIGLLLVYVFHPAPTVVVKFPSPYNAGKVTYEDKHDSCYKYVANKVECPADNKEIKSQPLFEDFINSFNDANANANADRYGYTQ